MEKFFKLKERGTNTRTEIIAGITTFITMSYIIMVQPQILSSAFEGEMANKIFNGVFFATCLSSFIGTFLMGIYAKIPFAQAPAMGVNAFFTYTIMVGMGYSYPKALAVVLLSGILFILLTITGFREKIAIAIPKNINVAISAGIGLFLAFVGLQNAGIVVANPSTFVSLVDFSTYHENPVVISGAVLSIIGLIIMTVLSKKRVPGAILIGIIIITILGVFTGNTVYNGISWDIGQQFRDFTEVSFLSCFQGIRELFDGSSLLKAVATIIMLAITFSLVDLFNTLGTLIGTAKKADLLDEHGNMDRMNEAMLSDAIATTAGAMLGTSTVSTYVESSAGIVEGGRTGLTSIVTSVLFLFALLLAPIIGIVPGCATAPALIFVGGLMIDGVKDLEFDDMSEAVPAFLTMALMPLTYSIADGIAFGLISYVLIQLCLGKKKKLSGITILIAVLFIVRFFTVSS